MSPDWYYHLLEIFNFCDVFLRVCWFKAIMGAWTTSARMHDGPLGPCIFGCSDAQDVIGHYFLCHVLRQLVSEQIGHENAIAIGQRLCLQNPSRQNLRHLALSHYTYHCCRNHVVIKSLLNDLCTHNEAPPWFSRCILPLEGGGGGNMRSPSL